MNGRFVLRSVCRAAAFCGIIVTGPVIGLASAPAVPGPDKDFKAAYEAYERAWAASDLVFTEATFTAAPAKGYGLYTPRETAAFSPAEPLMIYAEPVGFGFVKTDDRATYDLSVGFRLLNATGQVLVQDERFTSYTQSGRDARHELSTALTFQFEGLPAGAYELEATYRDEVDGKTGSFTLPFTITPSN
ncbi:hypothetical protein [Roseibium sp. RKSG952]|uniref:hypothetical protein n=1 Tax=Roseibium sp. RKSG952 TaxID=2529384 RepID=UPI0012BCE231|nr:hypothetical protein [Roseibium sp. RKSG952]MTI00626.1 hypothetical protein [Roseibium sp. RKSG952]